MPVDNSLMSAIALKNKVGLVFWILVTIQWTVENLTGYIVDDEKMY